MRGTKPERAGRSWSIALLFLFHVAVAFAALGANPFKGESITPLDVLVSQRAWRWIDPTVEVRQSERTDVINALLPTWIAARDQIREGRFPVWNDEYAGGNSLLTPTYSTYTPGFALFAAIPNPSLGFHLAIVFNLAIGGLGMHLLLRRHLSLPTAMCGAVTFQLCGFNAAWLYWQHVSTAIWAPWLLLAIDRCAETPDMKRALQIAGASALLILGGFPFVAELAFGMGAIYFVVLWLSVQRPAPWRRDFALWYAAGTGVGFLLCALPLLELATFLQHYDLGYRENRGSYLNLSYITRLVPPWAYEHRRVEQTMYVGLALLVLAVAAAITTLLRWKLSSPFARFGLLLLLVSAGLVFGLWPMSLVGWIPGMSFNSWSRGIILLDIAIIILGSIAIGYAWQAGRKLAAHRLVLAAIGFVIAAQLLEVGLFFNHYNGPVSSRYFYPRTPATDYMSGHTGPFDYVIADRSFHISGALGAYGLREWFGHQFRTPELKSALKSMVPSHFSSHTSSRFSRADIRVDSPTMSVMNVRYLAISSADPKAKGPGAKRPAKHRALPPMPAHRWIQQFSVDRPTTLRGITLRLATYRRADLTGEVRLALSDANGKVLAASRQDAASISDNAMADFFFPEPIVLPEGTYDFSLRYSPSPGIDNPRLTAWAAEQPTPGTLLRMDGKIARGAIEYVLQAGPDQLGPFRHILTANGISVFENTNSPRGPYFVDRLTDIPNADSGQRVTIDNYTPDRFVLRYSGRAPGFVVVPMSSNNGWSIQVDGAPASAETMLGIMPAVPVAGPVTITFEYRPHLWRAFAIWLVVLASILLALHLLQRRLSGPNTLPTLVL